MTRRTHSPRPARAAFTLIELLVVMAIIAILVGIIVPAVQNVRKSGERVKTVAEISQLATSAKAFEREFGFPVPQGFTVPTNITDPGMTTLKRMFPRGNFGAGPAVSPAFATPFAAGTALNPNQCLVFFLGGPGLTGWDPITPSTTAPGSTKKGPYYDFPANRVVGGSYVDTWGNPFAFFPSVNGAYSGSTNYGAPGTIAPLTSGGRWVNQDGVQVISAGPNGKFGAGGAWTPGAGAYTAAADGGDDLGNFNEGLPLGAIR